MSIRHNVFGAYVIKDGKPDDPDDIQRVKDYNALWGVYLKDESSKWGGFPTKKGFEKWLQKRLKEATDAV